MYFNGKSKIPSRRFQKMKLLLSSVSVWFPHNKITQEAAHMHARARKQKVKPGLFKLYGEERQLLVAIISDDYWVTTDSTVRIDL